MRSENNRAIEVHDAERVLRARQRTSLLPASLRTRLTAFRDAPPPAGCMLVTGLPVGDLPPTPASPTADPSVAEQTAMLLLTCASILGEAVGYRPEHGGSVVQNIVPVRSSAQRQTSTSSSVDLMFHTEAAFHPHRPDHLLLLCLRGDPSAETTVSSVHTALALVPADVVAVLFAPRFRCAVDESYLDGRSNVLGPPTPVLTGDLRRPTMVFDQDLMVGIDEEADEALAAFGRALQEHRVGVVLQAGDLLVIDNRLVVHGRSSFQPRYDGTDRWLQRAFVLADLGPSAPERSNRVITTVFGSDPDRSAPV